MSKDLERKAKDLCDNSFDQLLNMVEEDTLQNIVDFKEIEERLGKYYVGGMGYGGNGFVDVDPYDWFSYTQEIFKVGLQLIKEIKEQKKMKLEDLGYKVYQDDKECLSYVKEWEKEIIYITFHLSVKLYSIEMFGLKGVPAVPIDVHNAIHEKMIELGWLK